MSSRSPLDPMYNPYGQLAPSSASGQMNFVTSYPHPSMQMYSGAHGYLPMSYQQPYTANEFLPVHSLAQPTSTQSQLYGRTLSTSTAPLTPTIQQHSPKLSSLLSTSHRNTQHPLPSGIQNTNVSPSIRGASPKTTAAMVQMQNSQQPYSSTINSSNYFASSQCSPVSNMHVTNMNSTSLSQFSSISQLPPSSQSGQRNLSNTIKVSHDNSTSSQLKNASQSTQNAAVRNNAFINISQSQPQSSYLSHLSHRFQFSQLPGDNMGLQGKFHSNITVKPNRPVGYSKPMSSVSITKAPSQSSYNPNHDLNQRFMQSVPSSGSNSSPLSILDRRNLNNQNIADSATSNSNPYSVFSIFSLNSHNSVGRGRGKAEKTVARGRGRPERPGDHHSWRQEKVNPINWYKSPSSLLASSYSSDIEAMQADIIMDSIISKQNVAPSGTYSFNSTSSSPKQSLVSKEPAQQSNVVSQSSGQTVSTQQSSMNASRAASLAAIQIKMEQADSLSRNKASQQHASKTSTPSRQIEADNSALLGTAAEQSLNSSPTNGHSKGQTITPSKAAVGRQCNENNESTVVQVKKEKDNTSIVKKNCIDVNGGQNNLSKTNLEQQLNVQTLPASKIAVEGFSLKSRMNRNQDKKPLTAREKVFDLWKAGQVVGRAPGKSKGRCTDISTASSASSGISGKNSQTSIEKDPIKRNVTESISASNEPELNLCYIMLHGHKLICLKTKSEYSILLCQFQVECFLDKGVGFFNNCIDRALRIRKRILNHSKKNDILNYLRKNGSCRVEMVQTINLDDARRVYHFLNKITSCTNSKCVVELSNQQVDLSHVRMPKNMSGLSLNIKQEMNTDASDISEVGAYEKDKVKSMNKTEHFLNKLPDSETGTTQSNQNNHADVNDDDLILVEASQDPNTIHSIPGIPKTGGVCNTLVGQIRCYHHNNDNYLVVEDLCNIFSADDFYHSIEKEKITLYSCSADIFTFLNTISKKFHPLSTSYQSLIKEVDIGAHIMDENSFSNFTGGENTAAKRPICKQEKPDEEEYDNSSKKLRIDDTRINTENGDSYSSDICNYNPEPELQTNNISHQTNTHETLVGNHGTHHVNIYPKTNKQFLKAHLPETSLNFLELPPVDSHLSSSSNLLVNSNISTEESSRAVKSPNKLQDNSLENQSDKQLSFNSTSKSTQNDLTENTVLEMKHNLRNASKNSTPCSKALPFKFNKDKFLKMLRPAKTQVNSDVSEKLRLTEEVMPDNSASGPSTSITAFTTDASSNCLDEMNTTNEINVNADSCSSASSALTVFERSTASLQQQTQQINKKSVSQTLKEKKSVDKRTQSLDSSNKNASSLGNNISSPADIFIPIRQAYHRIPHLAVKRSYDDCDVQYLETRCGSSLSSVQFYCEQFKAIKGKLENAEKELKKKDEELVIKEKEKERKDNELKLKDKEIEKKDTEILILQGKIKDFEFKEKEKEKKDSEIKILQEMILKLTSSFKNGDEEAPILIDDFCRSSYLEVRRLSAIRKYLSQDVANQLAVSFILSKLDYCNSLYAGLQEKQLKKLQKVQNCAARVIMKKRFRDHVTPLLNELHWLPIKNRIAYKIASLCHRSLNDSAPVYLRSLLHQYEPPRNLRSSNLLLHAEPRYKQERYSRRSFILQGPLIWNGLPLDLKTSTSYDVFKEKLKTFLYNR